MRIKYALTLACALLIRLPAPAATVTYSSESFTGSRNNRAITIELESQGLAHGTNLVFGTPKVCQPTSGLVTTNLLAANYSLKIDGVNKVYHFAVPDTTNTYNIIDLINTNLLTLYPSPAAVMAAGSNINFRVSGGVTLVEAPNAITNGATDGVELGGGPGSVITANGLTASFNISDVPVTTTGGWLDFTGLAGGVQAVEFRGQVNTTNLTGTIGLTNLPTNQTNDLSGVLVTRITSATNDASTVLAARVTAATNDQNTVLSARVTNATNDLNNTLSARTLTKTNPVVVGAITGGLATGTNAGTVTTNDFAYAQIVPMARKAYPIPLLTLNTWYILGTGITYNSIKAMADFAVYSNLQGAFKYICIDDGWQAQVAPFRDAAGYPLTHAGNFTNGNIRPAVDYVHSLGLKIGLYYGGPVGYNGYYPTQDAIFLATNNIDYIKLDGLPSTPGASASDITWLSVFASESDKLSISNNRAPLFINLHGQPSELGYSSPRTWSMINSIFPTGDGTCHTWISLAHDVGNQRGPYQQFRVVPEFGMGTTASAVCECASTNYLNGIFAFAGVNALLSSEYQLASFAGGGSPVNWTDNGATVSILTNANLLSILQDPGLQVGYPILSNGSARTWFKPLGTPIGPEFAIAFWNIITNAGSVSNFTYYFTNLPGAPTVMNVLDVRNGTNFVATGSLSASCIEQEMKLYRLSPYVGPTIETLFSNGDYMSTSNGAVKMYIPYDVDASNYIARVSATYTMSTQEKIGVILLVNDYKSNGWWTNTDIIWPIIGTSTTEAAFNLKSTSFPLIFTNSPTISSLGLSVANSGSKAAYGPLLTGLVIGTTNNLRLFQYCGTAAPANGGFMIGTTPLGGFGGGAGFFYNGSSVIFVAGNDNANGTFEFVTTSDCRGPVIVSSGGTATTVNYGAVGASVGTPSSTLVFNKLSTTVIGVGCSGRTGGVEAIATMTVSGMDVGGYLPQSQWTAFRQAWDRFEARLGRKVP